MRLVFALGKLQVRRSGYGAMQLAGQFAAGPPPDRKSAIGVLRAAVAAGVDHIDTAQYYGPGTVNALIRDALHPYPGGLAIVSKVAARPDGGGAGYLRAGSADNLRSLGSSSLLRSISACSVTAARTRVSTTSWLRWSPPGTRA
jgi:aryl-alcohol dehydrogenase-like predicted oxidoreductase